MLSDTDSFIIQGVPEESDDFQMAVLMNKFEYKKQINYGVSAGKRHLIHVLYSLKITFPVPVFLNLCETAAR